MPSIRPFAALRPKPELASKICELPYDVMSSEEAQKIADGNPISFLRVSKPEIDLPPGISVYDDRVYQKGHENLNALIKSGGLVRDAQEHIYLYRQIMGSHVQTGLVALASCEEYRRSVIKKHELTRPDKEDDRVRHIETLNAQTGPAFLTYRAEPEIDAWVNEFTSQVPAIDFTASDGIRHSSWVVSSKESIQWLRDRFAAIPSFYIADGHHRSAAAARVSEGRTNQVGAQHFLSVIFPHNQMQILPYNRVVKDLNGATSKEFLERLRSVFTIRPATGGRCNHKHQLALFVADSWYELEFISERSGGTNPADTLDVTLLQNLVLGPMLGIIDPRTSHRIAFVGGIRGTKELESLVRSGEYACAFSMYPTGIEDLMAIADDGGIMPPKSTWFEPKLRDAMFCHVLDG